MDTISEPKNRISSDAVIVWRISNIIGHIIIIIVTIGLLWAGMFYDWYQWVIIVLWIIVGFDLLSTIWSIFIEPVLLQKYWRYGINSEFVQLKHGILNETHIIIPTTKIQYVEAKQGPLLRQYGLYTLSIGTIRTTHEIPALPEQEALTLRDQIAHHAKIKEME